MFEDYTPPVIAHIELLADTRKLSCDDAHFHIVKQLRMRGLELPVVVSSLMPNNRRFPSIRSIRKNADGTETIRYNGNRTQFGFCEYIVSDFRGRVYYDLDTLNDWLESSVFPICKSKPKRPNTAEVRRFREKARASA